MRKRAEAKCSYESLKSSETQDDLFEHCQSLFTKLTCERMDFDLYSLHIFAGIKHQINTHC